MARRERTTPGDEFPGHEIVQHTRFMRSARSVRRGTKRLRNKSDGRTGEWDVPPDEVVPLQRGLSWSERTAHADPAGIDRTPNDTYRLLSHASEATRDPAFSNAMSAMIAWGIAGPGSAELLDQIEGRVSDQENRLPQRVEAALADGLRIGEACRRVVCEAQPEVDSRDDGGDPLVAATARVKRSLERWRNGNQPTGDIGTTVRVISRSDIWQILQQHVGLFKLAKLTRRAPDNAETRRQIESGVLVRLPW